MGIGIWSMHFIGMLAFSLPIPLGYDLPLTLLSLLIAVLVSGFALWLVSQPEQPWWQLLCGALTMGAGISSMHYMGMHAMRMLPGIDYDPGLFYLSLAIAVAASGAALWIAFRLRHDTPMFVVHRLAIADQPLIRMHLENHGAALDWDRLETCDFHGDTFLTRAWPAGLSRLLG